jgi:Flp pilus assembly protein CpaB
MKAAILLFALAGLLFAGTATASAIDQPPQPAEGKVDCAPVIQVVCSTYYFVCHNYLQRCPIE